jgi:hypothetical protein
MSSKKGFGAVLGCLFLTLIFAVVSISLLYVQQTADDGFNLDNVSTNESSPNYDPLAAQHETNLSFLLLVELIMWGLTIVMCGVTLIVALTLL